MKIVLVLTFLLGSSFAWAAPNPADYTVNVHVVSSRLKKRVYGKTPSAEITQVLNVLIDGKKYELAASPMRVSLLAFGLIAPGNYKAKVAMDRRKGAYLSAEQYELLFPDGSTKKFEVIGESE